MRYEWHDDTIQGIIDDIWIYRGACSTSLLLHDPKPQRDVHYFSGDCI